MAEGVNSKGKPAAGLNFCVVSFTIETSGAVMETILQEFEKHIQQDIPMPIEEGIFHKLEYEPFPKDFKKKPRKKCSCSCSCYCQFNPEDIQTITEMLEEEIAALPIDQEDGSEVGGLSFEFMDEASFKDLLSGGSS